MNAHDPMTQGPFYWRATFWVEFSNTSDLEHRRRKVFEEQIEIEIHAIKSDAVKTLIKLFKDKINSVSDPQKHHIVIEGIELKLLANALDKVGVEDPITHLHLNRAVETAFGLKKYSLLRSNERIKMKKKNQKKQV